MENLVSGHQTFWRGKKVLVTGHSGFKGTWLAVALNNFGANVLGMSMHESEERLKKDFLSPKIGNVESLKIDIRDFEATRQAILTFDPDIVFHLAAQALVKPANIDPQDTISTNVVGTANVLQSCIQLKRLKAFICVTTDKVYANKEWPWPYRESDTLGGNEIYSASKACADILTDTFRNCFFSAPGSMLIATLRAGNVVGGGDWSDFRLIPDIVRSWKNNEKVEVRSPDAVRPWQHVLEPVFLYLDLAKKLYEGRSDLATDWNIGPSDEDAIPVRDLVMRAQKYLNFEMDLYSGSNKNETLLLKLDCSKLKQKLNWSPVLNLEDTLKWTFAWYQRFFEGESPVNLISEQIELFLRLKEAKVG
jgi:CDP-glucose 4,6-dehydratase